MEFQIAYDVEEKINKIIKKLELEHIIEARIICMRSKGSKAKAYARIWALPKIWRVAFNIYPFYIIEVISEHYDKLSEEEKIKVLIHELMHIPFKFSGGLLPHNNKKIKINKKNVEKFYRKFINEGKNEY